jgi:hypothetical protein
VNAGEPGGLTSVGGVDCREILFVNIEFLGEISSLTLGGSAVATGLGQVGIFIGQYRSLVSGSQLTQISPLGPRYGGLFILGTEHVGQGSFVRVCQARIVRQEREEREPVLTHPFRR